MAISHHHIPSVLIVSLLASTLATTTGYAATTGISSVTASADESNQIRLRKEFGLDASLAKVRVVDSSSQAIVSTAIGIPLSEEEEALVQSRDLPASTWEAFDERAASLPEFAGVWIEQALGEIVIGTVRGAPAAGEAFSTLRSILPAEVKVVSASLDFPRRTLDSLSERLNARIVQDTTLSSNLVQVALDDRANRVILTLLKRAPLVLLEELHGDYDTQGLEIRLVDANDTVFDSGRDNISAPAKGGYAILNSPIRCTLGAANLYNTLNQYYSVTAGHCGNGNWKEGWDGTGQYIGSGHGNGQVGLGASNCDCVAVGPLFSFMWSYWFASRNDQETAIMATAVTTQYRQGQAVCLSPGVTAYLSNTTNICGQIVAASATGQYSEAGGFTLLDAIPTNILGMQSGDSGSPLYSNNTWFGILSGHNNVLQVSYFSKSTNISARFNARYVFP